MDESKIEKPKIEEMPDTKDLVKAIQERKLDALPYLVDKLKIGSEGSDRISPEKLPEQEDYSKIEGVVQSLLNREAYKEKKEKYTEIINAAVELYKDADEKNEKFQSWSHSLCHLFEKYKSDYSHTSLLQPRFLKTSEKLVNECVSRGLRANETGCMDRVISPIINYNICNIKTKEDLGKYDFKPEILSGKSKELAQLFEHDRDKRISDFSATKTPKEFILKQMERREELFYEKPEKTVEILNLIKEDVSEEEMNSYLKDAYGINIQDIGGKNIVETLKIMKENVEKSREASEEVKGIFVDVEGTLIVGGKLNEKLLEMIEQESKEGEDIIIFTGGNPEEQTQILRKLGFPEKYLPVKDKKDYKGKRLGYLIDDTEPTYQGLQPRSYRRIRSETS